ncbi:MAG: uroporphyrinogen-III synthase [Pseudomonadota bacterium]|nr:uroporphyrinogen-III synthase [Pseudomonadota bacterium]
MKPLPLEKTKILLTRPAEKSQKLEKDIKELGGESILFPVIDFTPLNPKIINKASQRLLPADIIIFISKNAAINGANHLDLSNCKILAVGPTTNSFLSSQGLKVNYSPEQDFTSESLLKSEILSNVNNKTITIVRGDSGRELLKKELCKRGAKVQYLITYKKTSHRFQQSEINKLRGKFDKDEIDFVLILSLETFENLMTTLQSNQIVFSKRIRFIVPSQRIANKINKTIHNEQCIITNDPREHAIIEVLINNSRKCTYNER